MEFTILLVITALCLLLSFFKDRKKTKKALMMAGKRTGKISLPILLMVLLVSVTLYFLPPEVITRYLGSGNRYLASLSASLIGSIILMPGFIAFPLGGVLRESDVPYMVIAAFTSSLMMVGIMTVPVERQYLGLKVSVLRNIIAFAIALVTAFVTGLAYGEVF